MLIFYDREKNMPVMKEWYDGYLFGNKEVYNPWSVINYVKNLTLNPDAFPTAAWSNTSSNSIVKDLIYHAGEEMKQQIEALIRGETIEKKVHDAESNLVNSNEVKNELSAKRFFEINENEPKAKFEFSEKNILDLFGISIWNFLYFTGYLKGVSVRMEGVNRYITMAIPNNEILYIYDNTVSNWFRDEVKVQDLSVLYAAMLSGNLEIFKDELVRQLRRTISYMDHQEAFYHGFIIGILANLNGYLVKSNREAGDGRYDICVYSLDETIPPVIIEVKVAKTFKAMAAKAQEALDQIETKQYDAWLPEEGYTECIRYGAAFYKKKCLMKMERKTFEIE